MRLSSHSAHIETDAPSVSNCAVLLAATTITTEDLPSRVLLMGIFSVIYLGFVIVFGIRLSQWDAAVPGHCYDTHLLAAPYTLHPAVDQVYLAITCLYMYGALFYSLSIALGRRFPDRQLRIFNPRPESVFVLIMMQLPLHLYYLISMRVSNEPLLSDGTEENQWGFGQVFALIMSASLVVECAKGYFAIRSASTKTKK